MKSLIATEEVLEMANGTLLGYLDEYGFDTEAERTFCRWSTEQEKIFAEQSTVSVSYPVCFIGDDRRMLMETIDKGTVSVPVVRKNGKPVEWKIQRGKTNIPTSNAVKCKAHGHGNCAWFIP